MNNIKQLRLMSIYRPQYACITRWVVSRWPYLKYFIYIVMAFLPVLLAMILSFFRLLDWNKFIVYWLKLDFSGWIIGAFVFMDLIYKRTINYFYDFCNLFKNKIDGKIIVEKSYTLMFNSNKQIYLCLFIGALTTITGVSLNLDLQNFTYWYIVFWSFVAGYIVGWGMWYTIIFAVFVKNITTSSQLDINPIYPSSSPGISQIIKLSNYWSKIFFLEFVLVYSGLVISQWSGSPEWIIIVQVFWLFVCIIVMLTNYFLPLIRVQNIVRSKTNEALKTLDGILRKIWHEITDYPIDNFNFNNESLKYYGELYNDILERGHYNIEKSIVVRLSITVIIPIITTIIIIYNFLNDIKLFENLF